MITRENIIERLAQKYPQYNFVPTDVTKNGDVHLQGISVRDNSPIAPTIYTDSIIERCNDNLDKAIEIISNIIEQHQAPNIDLTKLQDRDFILERIRIGVQKISSESLVKRNVDEFPGMEAYLYFAEAGNEHDMWSVKLRQELLDTAGISLEEAWQIAEKNTFEATTLQSMTEVLAEMMGEAFDPCLADTMPCEMYIVSNREKCKGAAGILNHELLRRFATDHDCKSIAVLCSSIHEIILIPLRDAYSIDELSNMVQEINATQVSPEDRLVDRAYAVNFD
ncbi:hypothetical protein D6853_09045 [Butyrivibrio sp. X503]|uniref:DUF5688 family protein n=1 Tax=Butyrivibrio sp. X503 TaxID=2364878 RepID=UPI000EAAA44A|nr:DUF5688 family protein [Butyrivibrio sp. X503]RKM55690.1 hypothetical protein D6853_09045 [Butyrivibrio sp. X503]